MVTTLIVLFILAHVHRAYNTPLKQFREARAPHAISLITPHQHTLVSHPHIILTPGSIKKIPNIISIPISQIYVPNLHVIPISHSNIHHTSHIPIISQTVSQSTANITHPTQGIPILFPYPHNLVPLHDLSVIPLQKPVHTVHKVEQQLEHYRVMEKKDADVVEEPVNYVRTIYGGFGNGLYYGGQGAGHGFHIFG